MDLAIVFAVFAAAMAVSLKTGLSMIWPLLAGLVLFSGLALRRGMTFKRLLALCKGSLSDSFIVVGILLIIGCLTGMWRQSGTIAYFVAKGVSVIPPRFFIPAAFLLSAIMSYAIGTSFGVTATAGVILMSISRAGGVDPVLTAGAILSGVYVGDRGSPASSSANLVAVLTHTDMRDNVRKMLRSSLVPFAACCVFYFIISLNNPMRIPETDVTAAFEDEFVLSPVCLIPAAIMIVLPFTGLKIKVSMCISLAVSVIIALFVQKAGLIDCARAILLGYRAETAELDAMLSGGGIVSMAEVSAILLVSGTYGAIFRGAELLLPVKRALSALAGRIGRYPVMLSISAGVCMLFCNQTISAIMLSNLSDDLYGDTEAERKNKMLDMENSVILVAGLVPWCIACSVPLAMMGVDARAVPFAFYLWLLPLYRVLIGFIRKRT